MAIRTGSPRGGGLTRFSPSSTYDGVASKYKNYFLNALSEEKRLAVNTKILAYQNGNIDFEELRNFLEQQIAAEGDTQFGLWLKENLASYSATEHERETQAKRAELEADAIQDGVISASERYDIEREMLDYYSSGTEEYVAQQKEVITAFENAQVEVVNDVYTQMVEELGGDRRGLTLQDQLQINLAQQEAANPSSDTYATLVEKEGQLRNKIFEDQRSGAALRDEVDIEFTRLDNENMMAETALRRGYTIDDEGNRIDVSVTDAVQTILENEIERAKIVDEAIQSGANLTDSQREDATRVETDLVPGGELTVQDAQLFLNELKAGRATVVEDDRGQEKVATTDQLIRDARSDNPSLTTPNVIAEERDGVWRAVDRLTGDPISEKVYGSKTAAQEAAREANTGFTVDLWNKDPTKRETWSATIDPQTGELAFSNLERQGTPAQRDIEFGVLSTEGDVMFEDLKRRRPGMFDASTSEEEVRQILQEQGVTGEDLEREMRVFRGEEKAIQNRPGIKGFMKDVQERAPSTPISLAAKAGTLGPGGQIIAQLPKTKAFVEESMERQLGKKGVQKAAPFVKPVLGKIGEEVGEFVKPAVELGKFATKPLGTKESVQKLKGFASSLDEMRPRFGPFEPLKEDTGINFPGIVGSTFDKVKSGVSDFFGGGGQNQQAGGGDSGGGIFSKIKSGFSNIFG